jgi:Zn-dependent peptidase ImmA (M78 family)
MTSAEAEAEQLVMDLGLKLPIIPKEVCEEISGPGLEIEYVERVFDDPKICGLSLSHGERVTVVVNANITNNGRKNFTAAHEIGHVLLHIQKNIQSSFTCSDGDINSSPKNSQYESEANEFASSLLMPRCLIEKDIHRNELSWALIQKLSTTCGTSLEATARRVITLSKEPCALIIHKNGEMWLPIRSKTFRTFIPKTTFPAGLEEYVDNESSSFPARMDTCDTVDWIRDSRNLPKTLSYQSIYNENHDRRMTLLVIADEVDEDEWDEPRFK